MGEALCSIYDNVQARRSLAYGGPVRGHCHHQAVPAFTLMRMTAAYWRGDEDKQAQRIYGTAWPGKRRDHHHPA